jgi:hypothetical protein
MASSDGHRKDDSYGPGKCRERWSHRAGMAASAWAAPSGWVRVLSLLLKVYLSKSVLSRRRCSCALRLHFIGAIFDCAVMCLTRRHLAIFDARVLGVMVMGAYARRANLIHVRT